MDISMDSYDEFVRENVPTSVVAAPDVKKAATSRIRLNLLDNSRIYLLLTQTEGSIFGQGNVTQGKCYWAGRGCGNASSKQTVS